MASTGTVLVRALLAGTMLVGLAVSPAVAGTTLNQPISTRNSFRLGDAGVLCTAQSKPTDPRLKGMFDRAYLITCRDAASAVGSVLAIRGAVDLMTAKSALPASATDCKPVAATITGLGPVTGARCHDASTSLDYLRYAVSRGKTSFVSEGLAGYDPAIRLALATVALDKPQSGVVQVATTEVSDPAAFARTQAGSLDAAGARAEAYARGNGSRFAESAEFFEDLASRDNGDSASLAEAYANQGLQQSNLGNFSAALRLMARAEAVAPQGDGVIERLLRNYRATNALNQRDAEGALQEMARKVSDVLENDQEAAIRGGLISVPLAAMINRASASTQQVAQLGSGLTQAERGAVLDAQGLSLEGIALRLQGKLPEAVAKLDKARGDMAKVRDGKVLSTSWLQSEIAVERAMVDEASGNRSGALATFDKAIAALSTTFPDSPALLSARARKAGFLLRSGDSAGARLLFDAVVKDSANVPDSSAALRGLLAPYFDILSKDGSPDAAAGMFRAAQVLQRPGVAQTQAILARQLSAGNDEASAMFRLAVSRTREIVRTEAEVARLSALATPTGSERVALDASKDSLTSLRAGQTALQSKLADYPRYKALSPTGVDLAELQAALREGEGYYKMMVVDDAIYALYATHGAARALKLSSTTTAMGGEVGKIRDSIVSEKNGQVEVTPFDLDRARALYLTLFGPIDAELNGLKHLVFEPDGPMLELPPYVLPTRQAGVDAYKARIARPNGDEFDFTGVDWLGRGREVSISVSPRSFLDVRAIAPSRAREAYLGFGHNALAVTRPAVAVADDCDWPMQVWQRPISADELKVGAALFGPTNSRVVTDAAFTDTALLNDKDLDNFRIVHFATHGLVTAPRPECPARPALVTSFAADGSDGLLSFKEIFDLKLDADVVILSACDTAGSASVGASREAGVATGGNYALDGLVRAFVGAGARSVVASHWPVPDEFDATKRLISGLLGARPGEPLAQALGEAQRGLMDDPKTSHPFYWAAFIILGDGAKPLVAINPASLAKAPPPVPAKTASR
ncbi:MAG: CHAT domain-containing protein [Sphingomicrobium sp.]